MSAAAFRLCAFLILTLLLPGPALAYTVMKAQGTGVELRWTSLPMKFKIHQAAAPGVSAAETYAAIRAAYKTWSSVSCSYFSTSDQGVVNQPSPNSTDHINTNIFPPSWDSSWGTNALGLTMTYYDPYSGKIVDADVVYNINYPWSTTGKATAIDIQSVATHEAGHQLGMDHSQYSDATMFYTTGAGDTSNRSLSSDDIAGICYLYPNGGTPPPECTTSAHCAANETCVNNKCVTGSKKGYGSTCTSGSDCISGICLQYGSSTFCSQMCDTTACPNNDKCLAVSGGGKACLPGSANQGTKLLGQACTTNLDCKSGICVQVTGKGYVCSQKCDVAQNNCPTGYYCASSSLGGLCIPGSKPQPTTPQKKLGESCTKNEDCISNICGYTGEEWVCTIFCDLSKTGSCPTGYSCVPVSGSAKGACIKSGTTPQQPKKKTLGESCTKNADCQSNLCVTGSGKTICSKTCNPATGCDTAGYDCVATGKINVCWPAEPAQVGDGEGGCSVSPLRVAPWIPLLLVVLPLLLVFRRRA